MATLWFEQALLPTGWQSRVRFHIAGGRFTAIEVDAEPGPGELRHGVALPGMANLHSHAFQRLMAGMAEVRSGPDGDDFWSWRDLMYRLVGAITPDDLTAIAAMAFIEMLESGFTRSGEFHYLHHQPGGDPYDDPAEMAFALAAAAAQTGIALTLLPVFYAHGGFGGVPPGDAQRRFVTDLDGFARLHDRTVRAAATLPDAVVGIAPHSLRAVMPDELAALTTMTVGPIHLHIAEQRKEVRDCIAWSGQRPVEWLLDHAPVDSRWCLVHATHVTDTECRDIAARGAVVGLCPITEANLGDGIFPAASFLAADGRFGIGTDSNVRIDLAEELRTLEYGQRLIRQRRTVLATPARSNGRTLFDAALDGGRQALAGGPALRVGAPADLVELAPAVADDGDRALDRWVFASGRVHRVWRAGVQLVADGRHRDRAAIAARFDVVARRLLVAA
ncbi:MULTISPECIES: formimidoylglutamate deiminase [unclassified Sphingomonas]|uniref:formimidoylglutamate deiminase n=1 Tax=unclassified Sphingomonas TaxID=196159 RepID=UPI0006F83559|nr:MULTISPECIES: formimidoylglutamate deiminase [unclassified Sphingomonas]KQM63122.1 N-formimino-L-glutamate deiminase [Sphingomonas sp. Leaf16]KQN14981.1 N-formimino-L-glutamate deiminase [Sphingomonas sp. Leaf29]KQN20495.1 N-formimino-L-glutamate deiminase [Sphingomonas sp. Leaf32]